jgi:hypothetical protein
MTVMYILQNWYSRSAELRSEARRIVDLVRAHSIDLAVTYINTNENLLADAISRTIEEHVIILDEEV